jgi:hypothetical protein
MKEFIDKLIERLENHAFFLTFNFEAEKYLKFNKVISIVNQLAEEYKATISKTENVGWIPCSKQEEPTENGRYLVYVQHYSNKDLYDTCMVDWFGEWKVSYEWNVIAWHPIAPYTEGE